MEVPGELGVSGLVESDGSVHGAHRRMPGMRGLNVCDEGCPRFAHTALDRVVNRCSQEILFTRRLRDGWYGDAVSFCEPAHHLRMPHLIPSCSLAPLDQGPWRAPPGELSPKLAERDDRGSLEVSEQSESATQRVSDDPSRLDVAERPRVWFSC
jgi:hypothetical protein